MQRWLASVMLIWLVMTPAGSRADGGKIVDLQVSFDVVNSNQSKVPCPTDGLPYRIQGRLVGQKAALKDPPPAVTVLLHGVDAVGYMHLTAFPQLDLARQLAARGHVVVALDRLGYGESGRPPGSASCLGGHADTTRQVIDRLRTGDYQVDGRTAISFDRVALAGHSGGGIVAQITAYSFPVVDALIVIAFADQGYLPAFPIGVAQGELPQCAFGADDYRYFFTDEDFDRDALTGVAPSVRAAVQRARNPCGDPQSFGTVLAVDELYLGTIQAPTLLLYGSKDALIDPTGAQLQESRYTGSSDVTTAMYDGGHTFFLQDDVAAGLQDDMSGWLSSRGF